MQVAFLFVARGFKIGIKSNLQIWNCVLPVASVGSCFVASPGIEPGSGASETLILSIVLRGHLFPKIHNITSKDLYRNREQYYAEKFSYYRQPTRAECSFYPF